MRSITKLLLVGCAAAAMPMMAAVTLGGSWESSDPDDEFSLRGAFIDSGAGGFSAQCWNSNGTVCTVPAPRWMPGGFGSGGSWGGGGGGYDSNGQPDGDQNTSVLGIGIDSTCIDERAITAEALNFLNQYSPTAHDMINMAANRGTDIALIRAIPSGSRIEFDYERNRIHWDPFVAFQGTNSDGSPYALAPVMVLIHELIHAARYGLPDWRDEAATMVIANQIAREINQSTGRSYNTNRDVHEHVGRFNVTNVMSDSANDLTLQRPGCPS